MTGKIRTSNYFKMFGTKAYDLETRRKRTRDHHRLKNVEHIFDSPVETGQEEDFPSSPEERARPPPLADRLRRRPGRPSLLKSGSRGALMFSATSKR